jgi:3-oxoacyl-[acyl-carrier protein] reductase
MKNFLVFGATGSIGAKCVKSLLQCGTVIQGERNFESLVSKIDEISFFDAVIWAQGVNDSDSIVDFEVDDFQAVLHANLIFILETTNKLLKINKINSGSQLVVISSVWSQISRPNKLSYSISKAAVSAAVRSMATDLGPRGIQVNAIAPGPIESPMTRKNLSPEQIAALTEQTPLKRLVTLTEIAEIAALFANGQMSGVSGQEIIVDGGWSVSKLV